MSGILPVYALGHFAVDFVCAWLLLGRMTGLAGWPLLALGYNFCAFALQMPLGVLADRLGRNRMCSSLGALLVCAACLPLGPWPSTVLAGVGNALYHLGGGRETLLESRGYGPLGVFVAPGAVGIFLGSLLRGRVWAGGLGTGLLALCGGALLARSRAERPSPRWMEPVRPASLWRAGVLFLVVLARSLVGMCMASPWKTGAWVALGALLGAAGKAAGGLAADRLGGRTAGAVSLLLAAALFLFPANPVCGVLAGLLFHMSMPITLRDSARLLPGGEGFTFGLLTFALFLGFLPAYSGISLRTAAGAALAAVSGLALALVAGRRVCTT